MSRKDAIGTAIGSALLGLLGLAFACAGLWADALVMRAAYDDLRMTAWNETPCDILTAQLVAAGAKTVTYQVEATYAYKVDGVKHLGRRVTTIDGSDNVSSFHQRAFAELEQCRLSGKPFRCYVDPTHPDEAILYRDTRWEISLVITLVGLMFSSIGFGLMGLLIYSARAKPSSARKLPIDEAQPWLARADWAAGEIRHGDRLTGRVLSWLGWPMLVISAPSLLASLSEMVLRANLWAVFGLIPTGIAMLFLHGSRRLMARWRRYGDSTFQMAAVPGVVGGQLAGVIRTEGPVDSSEGFRLKLDCKQTERNSSSSNSGHTSRGLWENEHAMQVSDTDGTAIPVLFHLPFDTPQTCSDSGPVARTWHLSVQALNPAADYRAKFEVPVFRTSASDPHYKPDDRELAPFEVPVDAEALLQQAQVRVDSLAGGGLRVIFPRGRNLVSMLPIVILQTILLAAIVGAVIIYWQSAWVYAAPLVGFVLLHSLIDHLFYRSELEVTAVGLLLKEGILSSRAPQEIRVPDLAALILKPAASLSTLGARDLFAELKTGTTTLLAKRIYPQAAAEEVVRRIDPILNLPPRPIEDALDAPSNASLDAEPTNG